MTTMITYNNIDERQQDDPDGRPAVDTKLVAILSVLLLAMVLLLWLHSYLRLSREQAEQDAAAVGHRRQRHVPCNDTRVGDIFPQVLLSLPPEIRNQAIGWDDRAPSSMAAAAVEVPSVSCGPPLVCMYRKADGWRQGSCGVCLVDLADGEAVTVLPACVHYFHVACVSEWLRAHHTCPLCRSTVNPSSGPAMC